MTDILDTIDESLQEVEEQLLQEFDRIRNKLSDARFEAIDHGIKNALDSVVTDLKARLEQTGDRQNLQLMTERHEVLFARLSVLKQLLNAKVPTAFLHEAHQEVKTNRRKLEAKVTAKRQQSESTQETTKPTSGFVSRLKGIFSSNQTEKELNRNHIKVTAAEQKALEPVSVYLDNGIYSASRELAALANVFNLPEQQKEALQEAHEKKMKAVISGKAQFVSKDLSAKPASDSPTPGKKSIAQTPEEIRRKLSERAGNSTGKASFSSKDINHAAPVDRPDQAQPRPKSAAEIAAERRAELEAEKARQPTTGKASFISKDIEPIVPQEAPQRRSDNTEKKQQPESPRSGKAVFESRDLSPTPPRPKS
jgi:uncharacterized protein YicC (UPF0701 family)